MYDNRRYLIIPTTITGSIDFNQVHETSIETLRLSVDGTQTFVKYDVTVEPEDRTETTINPETGEEQTTTILAGVYGRPSIYSEEYSEHTHSEILEVLSGEEWTAPMDYDMFPSGSEG
jgi:hypothetical protein